MDSAQPATGRQSVGRPELGPLPPSVLKGVKRAAKLPLPLLLEGETGTGKTYVAEWIHALGPRVRGPFEYVDCPNLPASLIEAELRGHDKGAYTDARHSRAGAVERAHGGTLFLDEVAELPLDQQAKLLSLFDNGWVQRIGGTRRIAVDVRIICATNRSLPDLVERGRFRSDLYYRCRGMAIRLPPLRERPDDIPVITRFLLSRISARASGDPDAPVPPVEDAVVDHILEHPWPGNIRELRHVLEAAFHEAGVGGGVITAEHIRPRLETSLQGNHSREVTAKAERKPRYKAPPPAEERRMIVDALADSGGNKTRASKLLGMSRHVLWERLQRYGITEAEWRSTSEAT